jgi:hypothetical protein
MWQFSHCLPTTRDARIGPTQDDRQAEARNDDVRDANVMTHERLLFQCSVWMNLYRTDRSLVERLF